MFPPVDPPVLENNPDFAKLYKTLTTSILNPDGTTRADPAAKSRDAVRAELRTQRLKDAKRHLLISSLSTTTAKPPRGSPPLPDALLDLLVLLPPLLTTPLDPDSTSLLLANEPCTLLPELLPHIAQLLSTSLHESALCLARIAHPHTNPSYLHRNIPSLPQTIQTTLLSPIHTLTHTTLPAERLATLSTLLTPLLEKRTEGLAALIHALEGKHAAPARSLELRAAHLAHSSEQTRLLSEINLHGLTYTAVYPPEVRAALENYAAHLRDATTRVEGQVAHLERVLGDYGVGVEGGEARERTLREMSRVYKEMRKELDEVRGDLNRLQNERRR